MTTTISPIAPVSPTVTLTARQRACVEQIARRQTNPQRLVRRAKVLLAMDAGANNSQIARQMHLNRGTVCVWRHRVVYRHTADKYHRLTRPTFKGPKSSIREGSHGIPAALASLWTSSKLAVWTHGACSGHLILPLPTTLFAHTSAGCGHGGTRNSSTSRSVQT
jgi:DNA-binding CsgD family transcriptional regulator